MEELSLTYSKLLDVNKQMFENGILEAAYHALSAAMYVALALQDAHKMALVETLAQEQYQSTKNDFAHSHPSTKPTEPALYASLLEIVTTRKRLL